MLEIAAIGAESKVENRSPRAAKEVKVVVMAQQLGDSRVVEHRFPGMQRVPCRLEQRQEIPARSVWLEAEHLLRLIRNDEQPLRREADQLIHPPRDRLKRALGEAVDVEREVEGSGAELLLHTIEAHDPSWG